jgi:hypothetical protein
MRDVSVFGLTPSRSGAPRDRKFCGARAPTLRLCCRVRDASDPLCEQSLRLRNSTATPENPSRRIPIWNTPSPQSRLGRAAAIYCQRRLCLTVELKLPQSYYLKRQCYIRADLDEPRIIAAMTNLVGEDRFFWTKRLSHPDQYVKELHGTVAGMKRTARRSVLGENARAASS